MLIFVLLAIIIVVVKFSPFFFLWERIGFIRACFWLLYIEIMIIDTISDLFSIFMNQFDFKEIFILLIILVISLSIVIYYLHSCNMSNHDIFIFLIIQAIISSIHISFIYQK